MTTVLLHVKHVGKRRESRHHTGWKNNELWSVTFERHQSPDFQQKVLSCASTISKKKQTYKVLSAIQIYLEQYGSFPSSKGTPSHNLEMIWHRINTLTSCLNFNWDLFDHIRKPFFVCFFFPIWSFYMWFFGSQKFSYWCQPFRPSHLEHKIIETFVKLFSIPRCSRPGSGRATEWPSPPRAELKLLSAASAVNVLPCQTTWMPPTFPWMNIKSFSAELHLGTECRLSAYSWPFSLFIFSASL